MTDLWMNLSDKIDRILDLICMAEENLPITQYDSKKNSYYITDIERLEKDANSIREKLPNQIDKEIYDSINDALKQIHDALIRMLRMFLQDSKFED